LRKNRPKCSPTRILSKLTLDLWLNTGWSQIKHVIFILEKEPKNFGPLPVIKKNHPKQTIT
jgi:hypothetical protein